MTKGIQIIETGGVDKLKYVDIPDHKLEAGEVRIRHTAIGVNFIDIYYRTGMYRTALPSILGVEAAGVVSDIGAGVENFKVGDRVAYGTSTTLLGAYSTYRNMPQQFLVTIPPYVDDATAAALMLKGMTAHMLCRRVITLQQGWNILVHAAAGGVGTLVSQWAKYLGCNVIGTVGADEKKNWAFQNGCSHVINYTTEDFVAATRNATGGRGVEIAYDGVGKNTFQKSLDCIAPFGLMCSFGQSSGRVDPVDILQLSRGSLFMTRPILGQYKADKNELQISAIEIFEGIKQNFIDPKITHKIPLQEAAEAHRLLEGRKTMGSIVLIP
jgi:NADPH2:quinone reductase